MLRDMIIRELADSHFERLLSERLHRTCYPDSEVSEVVREINTFLLVKRFNALISLLDETAPLRDLVVDFSTMIVPSLRAAGQFGGVACQGRK